MRIYILILSLILFQSAVLTQRTPDALKDQVKQLDGYYNFTSNFEMYSGYLTIQQQPQISIHYILITSMRNSTNDDLTLWLNGGPGCSSLLGFAQQVGPNMLLSGSKFFSQLKNPYSWNQISNMLFFESPAGVGYSINDDTTYNYTDPRTAQDGLKALQQFYKRFPEFKKNKFWISGQSYCGMYIPFLANEILNNDQTVNLQGILIGNGAMWLNMDWRRSLGDKFAMSHYYYGPQISQLLSKCKYNTYDEDASIPSCARGMAMSQRAMDLVNPYMTTGICYTPKSNVQKQNINTRRFSRVPFHTINNPLLSDVQSGSDSPCTDDEGISLYFNLPKVRDQLRIKRNDTWTPCSEKVGQKYHMSNSSLEFFPNFKAKGLKVLLYSGNVDAVVPYVQTEAYIKMIGWKQTSDKLPFVNPRGSLMGWRVEYEGLTYAIINGAGHMVPGDKPNAAYIMFKQFIQGGKTQNEIVSQ